VFDRIYDERGLRACCCLAESGLANQPWCDSWSVLGGEASMDGATLF
jgi:hypothetical protein